MVLQVMQEQQLLKTHRTLGNITGNRNAAGIVGGTYSNIENCVNKGKVYSTVGFAGGIVAEMSSGSVKNCINTGGVESKKGGTIGGIVGYGNGSTTSVIENCISLGKVTTEVNRHYSWFSCRFIKIWYS